MLLFSKKQFKKIGHDDFWGLPVQVVGGRGVGGPVKGVWRAWFGPRALVWWPMH